MDAGYELIRRIAQGGMGEVFVARRTGAANFEKRVALKLLLPHLADSPDTVRRFHDEARLAARMHHPNIVEIFDIGDADGRPFIAMQLVDGVTLSRLIRELAKTGTRMPLPLVRLIATGLCEALAYAHGLTDQGGRPLKVVHRDVTPGNVLVSRNGAVLLTDFGIAQARDSARTEPGVLKGKAAYLAPEQLQRDRPVDARTDLYALALTLYELLTGTNPYRRATMSESLAAAREGRIEPVEALRPDVGPRMAKALHQALSRDPDARFSSARAFRAALIDAEVAPGPDLADFVQAHCPDVMTTTPDEDANGPNTRSVVLSVTPSNHRLAPADDAPGATLEDEPEDEALRNAVVERPPPSRAPPLVVLTLLLLAVASAGGWWWLSQQEARPVRAPAPVPVPVERAPEVEAEVAPVEAPPEPSPVDPAPPQPEPVVRPAKSRPKVVVPAPTPQKMKVGYLTADATPWAEVEVGGQVLDRTPFSRFPLPVGKHQVLFRGPEGKTITRQVQVNEGEVAAIRVDF